MLDLAGISLSVVRREMEDQTSRQHTALCDADVQIAAWHRAYRKVSPILNNPAGKKDIDRLID